MADSSHNDVYEDDIVDDVFIDSDIAVVTDFDIDVGTTAAPRHRTMLASTHIIDLLYRPPTSPWAPYDEEPLFVIETPLARYLFCKDMPPEEVLVQVDEAYPWLLTVGTIPFTSTAIGEGLVGSVSALERPTASVTLNNDTGWFFTHLASDVFAGMAAGLFKMVRRQYTEPRLTGTIGSIRCTEDHRVIVSYGDFRRGGR